MKATAAAALLPALLLCAPMAARACRVPAAPSALQSVPADAVVLARVTSVEGNSGRWHATARAWAVLSGALEGRDFSFSDGSHVICGGMYRPRPGRTVILYLQRAAGGMRVVDASAYWWARRSGDPRLARLNALLPLGPVRAPTRAEQGLIALAEPRITRPAGETDLSGYAIIFARSSAGSVRATRLRAARPRRLMVDDSEEMPTEAMCGCTLSEEIVDLDDLWRAGRLPPFDP